ncbi:MAG: 16S rRNA (guanine(966)-N(2))-methyltransferase RsmD [Defluviitaleaceae bacterium]|nr:16S rRNA (guanine(966)-N(2))-methyltransferase RsmD [Defluviitaleaceae bacterium]
MRVIAGTAKRMPLVSPAGLDTRPTSDRAKESLFSILLPYLAGANFLDLFCGSGGIGIEALSRGAAEAVFVDSSQMAADAVKQNLTKTRLHGQVMGVKATHAIGQLAKSGQKFDIIFLDPPYEAQEPFILRETLTELALADILASEGIIIAETDATHAKRGGLGQFGELTLADTRSYGRASFLFYRRQQ